ncbi:MAG: DM13 domain-containing protein [Halioglobus sp.]
MGLKTVVRNIITHGIVLAVGFALGLYLLPILTAPPAPDAAELATAMQGSTYVGEFSREREDSDALHWGEGEFAIGDQSIAFSGKLAPGPDYRLYFSPQFVETEADFNRLKPSMVEAGSIKTFDGFLVALPEGIDPASYNALIVWCESFGQYITSATYAAK